MRWKQNVLHIPSYSIVRAIVTKEILSMSTCTVCLVKTVLFCVTAVGAILDATGSYVYPFIVSGISIALAGVVCLPVRRVAKWESERAAAQCSPT